MLCIEDQINHMIYFNLNCLDTLCRALMLCNMARLQLRVSPRASCLTNIGRRLTHRKVTNSGEKEKNVGMAHLGILRYIF